MGYSNSRNEILKGVVAILLERDKTHLESRFLRFYEWLEVRPKIKNILTTGNAAPLLPLTVHLTFDGIADKLFKGLTVIKPS